jgi:hypothetical protein
MQAHNFLGADLKVGFKSKSKSKCTLKWVEAQ